MFDGYDLQQCIFCMCRGSTSIVSVGMSTTVLYDYTTATAAATTTVLLRTTTTIL